MEKDSLEPIEREMNRTTNFLNFLIVQPQIATQLTDIEKDKVMAENLIRLKCCSIWSQGMIAQIEKKTSKEVVKAVNELFKLVKITEKK